MKDLRNTDIPKVFLHNFGIDFQTALLNLLDNLFFMKYILYNTVQE